ncbi:MAG: ornithine--oxo-acid transaminase [Chitinophagales bacterium]
MNVTDQKESAINHINSEEAMRLENEYGAHNYHPLPVVLSKGEGVFVWDPEGKKYYDFLSAYSAVNQGHCHPKIIGALNEQAQKLTLTSRAFYNDVLGQFQKYACEYFDYDRLLPMNSGAEAVETALKLCRKWAYQKRNVAANEAVIVVCENNFHGRTTTIVSFSDDEVAKREYGPYTPGFISVPYNDVEALKKLLESNKNIVGFLVEPIQGEAGIFVPDEDYLVKCKALCEAHNVLYIGDEIQTGIARTGKLLAHCGNCDCEYSCQNKYEVKPDILILGKAVSGGVFPVSAVLADDDIMLCIKPGEHGSTYGGNPLACAVAIAALEVVKDEKLAENAERLGQIFREAIRNLNLPMVTLVRGKGLLNAIVIDDSPESKTAWNLCLALRDNGLLAKPTHGNIIRLAPPLVITEEQLMDCVAIIEKTFKEFKK